MISLPILNRLSIKHYDLYPGPEGKGVDIDLHDGVTVLAGINGVGKTTLLNLALRMLLGPSSPKAAADIGRVSKRALVLPSRKSISYFSDRVPNLSSDATATIEFSIGKNLLTVTRYISTLTIKTAYIGNKKIIVANEIEFINYLAQLSGMNSGYDFHMVVRYLQFFTEERLPILWSASTQFEFFKILLLEEGLSERFNETYAKIQRIDTDYRNRVNQLGQKEKKLNNFDSDIDFEINTVRKTLAEAYEAHGRANKEYTENQKLVRELLATDSTLRERLEECETRLHEEERQYTYNDALYIQQALPELDDKLNFLMQGLGSRVGCFVCGTRGKKEHQAIGKKLRKGKCFVCDAKLAISQSNNVVPISSGELKKTESKISNLLKELEALENACRENDQALQAAEDSSRRTASHRRDAYHRLESIRSRLPSDEGGQSSTVYDEINRERDALNELKIERDRLDEHYRSLVSGAKEELDEFKDELSSKLTFYAKEFLDEDIQVSFNSNNPISLATGISKKVYIPTFNIKMASSTFESPQARLTPENVSESQKEFLDLAFRMAILDLITKGQETMMVVETPEASLDSWFMRRAAELMRKYSESTSGYSRKVIATSNLNGTLMIPSLLGLVNRDGNIEKTITPDDPHLVNLMELTAEARVLGKHDARELLQKELRRYFDG